MSDCAVRELVVRVFRRALDVPDARHAALDAGALPLLKTETPNEAALSRLVAYANKGEEGVSR